MCRLHLCPHAALQSAPKANLAAFLHPSLGAHLFKSSWLCVCVCEGNQFVCSYPLLVFVVVSSVTPHRTGLTDSHLSLHVVFPNFYLPLVYWSASVLEDMVLVDPLRPAGPPPPCSSSIAPPSTLLLFQTLISWAPLSILNSQTFLLTSCVLFLFGFPFLFNVKINIPVYRFYMV